MSTLDELPLDLSHPAVRDYIALTRLQVLTPLSLVINMATVLICSLVVSPSIGKISKLFPTAISPQPHLIAGYVLLIFILQVGYCVLLVIMSKPETKQTAIKGVGMSIVISNFLMAAWAVTWIFRMWLASTILLGLLSLVLLYCNVVLFVYHPPTSKRPLDHLLIHVPVRLFLILPLTLLFPYSLFVTLGLAWDPAHEDHYAEHQWAGFGVVLGVNILGLLVVILRRDITWCVGATWICVSQWALRPKPAPVYITTIMFTVLHPLALVASAMWVYFISGREGRIALPPDSEEQHGREGEREPEEVRPDWS